MRIKENDGGARARRWSTALAAGGLLGALASVSCCVVPLALFGLGVSGAWIANFTSLAPYQPYFIAGAVVLIGAGYGFARRGAKPACAGDAACASPVSRRLVAAGFLAATLLVAAALAVDVVGPLWLLS